MAFNPFSNQGEDTSFEQGNPIQQSTKNAVKATSAQIQQQQKAFTKALTDQLYGPTTDTNNLQGNNAPKEQPPGMETIQKQLGQNDSADEKQLEETRKKLQELQRMHKENYYEKNVGENAIKRVEEENKQREQQKLQEEQAIAEQDAAEKAAQEESMGGIMPQGKTSGPGRQRMQKPIALKMAETKTEIHRGSTG